MIFNTQNDIRHSFETEVSFDLSSLLRLMIDHTRI